MSEQHQSQVPASALLTLDELARLQHATPIDDPKEFEADIWESDEELEAFLVDLRSSRAASLG